MNKKRFLKSIALVSVITLILSLTSCKKEKAGVPANNLSTVKIDDMVYLEPEEYGKAFSNPMMGFRGGTMGGQKFESVEGYETTIKTYIPWSDIEKNADSTYEDIIAYTDKMYGDVAKRNVRIVPRVYICWPQGNRTNEENENYWPEDMTVGDFSSEQFIDRAVKLTEKMALAWDNDPRVAYVEMGLYGFWGEQHLHGNAYNMSVDIPDDVEKALGDAFTTYFKNKKVQVRYGHDFKDYDFGFYCDSFGHYDAQWDTNEIKARDAWRTNIIGSEVAYDWGNYKMQPGKTPDNTVLYENHREWMIDMIRDLHCTGLGWIAGYDKTDENIVKGADEIQKAFGYRYIIEKFGYTDKVGSDNKLKAEITIKNVASAPFYYDWDLTLNLLDPKTLKPVYSEKFDANITEILPGDNYNKDTNVYETEAKSYTYSLSASLPKNLKGKSYIIAVSINDPSCDKPAIRFDCKNYINGGYHPMGTVGVGTDAEELVVKFNDVEADKTINYVKD